MNIFSTIIIWSILALYLTGAVSTVATVGKDRKPLTAGTAAGGVLVSIAAIVGLLFVLWSNR